MVSFRLDPTFLIAKDLFNGDMKCVSWGILLGDDDDDYYDDDDD